MDIGDQVLLVVGGQSVFEILEIDGDNALVQSIEVDVPGRYPFTARLAELVAADPM
ncbi:hypothetical protein [Nocardia altamirensis]|uniref:hypothetical protein n=1 Tax=Nocardia altamirensis TaxID=472158 RepID=UPI0014355DD9|nr:hypothetical protein [Nocardia altamirensis]